MSRKVGAICEVCGWAWQPVVAMCHLAGLAACGMNPDLGRSASKAGILMKVNTGWVRCSVFTRSQTTPLCGVVLVAPLRPKQPIMSLC